MEIEIQEFYSTKPRNPKCDLTGTLSIYVIDCDLDIRGIIVERVKGKYYFRLPSKAAFDAEGKPLFEGGKHVRYPTVTFTARQKHDKLIGEIRKLSPAFSEQKLTESTYTPLKPKAVPAQGPLDNEIVAQNEK